MFSAQIFERNECSKRNILPIYLVASHVAHRDAHI